MANQDDIATAAFPASSQRILHLSCKSGSSYVNALGHPVLSFDEKCPYKSKCYTHLRLPTKGRVNAQLTYTPIMRAFASRAKANTSYLPSVVELKAINDKKA